jgi:putative adhesin
MRVERPLIGVALACAAVFQPLGAQERASDGPVLGRRALRPNAAVKGWNSAGIIRFVGWDKDSIVMRGRVPRSRHLLFVGGDSAMKVGTEPRWTDTDTSRADLVVYLPRRAMVSAKAVTGDITATDVGGWFYTVSGNIRLAGSVTAATVESMSGNLDLDVATPWIKAQTGSGHLLLRGAAQDADLSTVGGTLSIASPAVLRGQFSSVTGDIQYAALPMAGAIFEFSNHSGAVDLLLPDSASASLTLSSITGPIENGFARVRPASGGAHAMRVVLGRGDAQIIVRSFKGVIRLRRQP